MINTFLNVNEKDQALVLLYGLKRNNSENLNQNIINAVIKYLKSTVSFDRLIFDENQEMLWFFLLNFFVIWYVFIGSCKLYNSKVLVIIFHWFEVNYKYISKYSCLVQPSLEANVYNEGWVLCIFYMFFLFRFFYLHVLCKYNNNDNNNNDNNNNNNNNNNNKSFSLSYHTPY